MCDVSKQVYVCERCLGRNVCMCVMLGGKRCVCLCVMFRRKRVYVCEKQMFRRKLCVCACVRVCVCVC